MWKNKIPVKFENKKSDHTDSITVKIPSCRLYIIVDIRFKFILKLTSCLLVTFTNVMFNFMAIIFQSVAITMISYVGKMRIAFAMEEGFIDQQKFKSSIENAFEIMFKAALHSPN